jgi:hypothetical protein
MAPGADQDTCSLQKKKLSQVVYSSEFSILVNHCCFLREERSKRFLSSLKSISPDEVPPPGMRRVNAPIAQDIREREIGARLQEA